MIHNKYYKKRRPDLLILQLSSIGIIGAAYFLTFFLEIIFYKKSVKFGKNNLSNETKITSNNLFISIIIIL